jgi:hypothetical protein
VQWKAQRCQQYTKVDFRTRLFRSGSDLVVEFQKRKVGLGYCLPRACLGRAVLSVCLGRGVV